VIIHNDFREFDKEANEVDKRMYYVNTWIYRVSPNEPARNENSKVFIPDTKDPLIFISQLAHELGHSVIDPINIANYAKYAKEVYRVLSTEKHRYVDYANVISDIIVGYYLAKDKLFSKAWRHYIINLWNQGYNTDDRLKWALYAYYDKLFKGNLGLYQKYKKVVDGILKVLNRETDKVTLYREIARILERAPEYKRQDQKERGKAIAKNLGGVDQPPIIVKDVDVDELIEAIAKEANNAEDLELMIRALDKALGDERAREQLRNMSSTELLYRLYQAEANKIRIRVSYPQKPSYNSVKLGTRKWRLSDGFREIDVKKTLLKYGLGIPSVTLRAPYKFRMRVPSDKGVQPLDLVISIDVSGSVGFPVGLMMASADYITIMLYALIDEAKRIGQKVGVTLWSDTIKYTTLPKCLDYREVERIKKEVLDINKWGGSTYIKLALDQAKCFPDKLFIVLTDGAVSPRDLIDVDNVIFFLTMPNERDKDMFLETYGRHRVVIINDLRNLPKIALEWFRARRS